MEKMTLNVLVRNEAANAVVDNTNALAVLHHSICKDLVEIADREQFPMGVLVYIAVGTSAHKPMVFNKGYKTINKRKAISVISMCKLFANKFGDKYRTNDKVVHMMSRYYEIGGSKNKLRSIIDHCEVDMAKQKFDTAKVLSKLLFEKDAEFSKGGYIVGVKTNK